MLDNVGGYQIDKVKFALELTPFEAGERLGEFALVFGQFVGQRGGKSYNVVSVKKGERDGTYLYLFDVWGEAAALCEGLTFEAWYPYLSRVDLKTAMPMTEEGRDNYRDYLKEVLRGKRSVRLNDSPPRQKRGSRDAGGHTLALGSHKSDFRVHWTLRTDEDGYQEFQLEGSRLQGAIGATSHWLRNGGGPEGRCSWLGIMQALLMESQIELHELDNLHDSERASILQGNIDGHGIIERKLRWLEEDISKLPKDAVYGLYVALEQKLFGEPNEPGTVHNLDNEPNAAGEGEE